MADQSRSDLIRNCFAACKALDRKGPEPLFADDFVFTSPYHDSIGKAEYFARCWPYADRSARSMFTSARPFGTRLRQSSLVLAASGTNPMKFLRRIILSAIGNTNS